MLITFQQYSLYLLDIFYTQHYYFIYKRSQYSMYCKGIIIARAKPKKKIKISNTVRICRKKTKFAKFI